MGAMGCVLVFAADWPSQSGGPQREGWAKSERILSKENIADLKILYTYEPQGHSSLFLSAPIVNGNLITYKGFKEMLVFSANSSRVFSVDADLNKLIWQSQISRAAGNGPCSGDTSAPVAMAGSSSATLHFSPPPIPPGAPAGAAPGATPAATSGATPGATPGTTPGATLRRRRTPYFPPLAESLYPLLPTTLTQLNAMYTVSADGALHVLNSSTGEDLLPPTPFLPAGARVGSLNLRDNVIYATTSDSCDGKPNALYAVDLLSSDKHVVSFAASHGGFAGLGGTTIAPDGTIFVQMDSSPDDKPGHYHETVVALTPKDLKVKAYFTAQGKEMGKRIPPPGITPMVFSWHGKNMVIAGFDDGRLYVLSADALGGADHRTAVFQSEPIAKAGKSYDGSGFRGTFASWPDVDSDSRWFYASVIGPVDGGIQAFRLQESNGNPQLQQVWTSPAMVSPDPPVIANGLIFALSTGHAARLAKKNGKPYSEAEKKALAKPAVLYALDAITGRQLYSSGAMVPTAARPNGMAVANARVYFSGDDGLVYCFGLPKTQPQLAEKQ